MSNLINFYRLCIFFNLMSTMYIFTISTYETINEHIEKALAAFMMINFMKIFNQSLIVKYLMSNISNIYKKLLTFDVISDVLKFMVCNYLITNQTKICTDSSMCVAVVIIYINFVIIICHLCYKCCRAMRTRDEIENYDIENDNVEYIAHTQHIEIYVPIEAAEATEPNYNVINYTVTKGNNITCPICLEEQKLNENWTKLHCEHNFHKKCISNWLHVNNICPVCRSLINNVNNANSV